MLAVCDTGIGMNVETQSRIFEPFFTTKEPGKGTGLGLASVYGVVKQSGGAISVESEPSRGSAFKIFLPACESEPCRSEDTGSSVQPASGNETILLVEDQIAIRDIAGEHLRRLGYEVLVAPDGEAAIELARSHDKRIHLLVTDMVMPNMGGRELAVRLAEIHADTKVLFMSGYPDTETTGLHDALVDAEILRKPFSMKILAHKARSLLDARPGTTP
jgi:CheY-like chemotaxis protein